MKSILVLSACLALAAVAFAQTDTTTTQAPTSAPAATGEVKRAQFTTAVTEREPVDELTTLAGPAERVFFFTEFVGMSGRTLTHKWSLDGQSMGDVAIAVGADRWRCYSTKSLTSSKAGTWTVDVVDDAGNTLVSKSLTFTAAP
jgi:hypothetical protein